MLKGKGQVANGSIVCPLHRWTYSLDGTLLGAPHFPRNPCLHLPRQSLQKWNGMLFNGKRDVEKDLAKLRVAQDLNFSGFLLDKVVVTEYNFNWKRKSTTAKD